MDNKIKYVDLNGLKMFAESLKQDLKNHVIELGLYQELLHRIENLELYKIVDFLPEIGDEDTIYLLKNPSGSGDKNVFIEYLYNNEHGWEEIGNFTPSFDLEDYLKVEDAPFEKGDAENSAVLKGGNNQVISENGVALGSNNVVGLKVYPFIYIDKTSKAIYLSNENTELVTDVPAINTEFIHPYSVGDTFSIHLGSNFYNYGTITAVNGNKITVDTLPNDLPTSDAEKRYFFYVFAKADKGIIDIGQNSFAHGVDNYVYNEASYAEGKENNAFGKYSHVEGKENDAYWCAHAEGSGNIARGNASHVEGSDNIAANSNSHAEGRYTKATGYAAHAEGQGESLTNPNLAEGAYSHVEGEKTKAYGIASHSEGILNVANGKGAHTEGRQTQTNADYAHAEGYLGNASGSGSHAEGVGTQTKNNGEHAEGRFNKSNSAAPNEGSNPGNTAHSVGIGTSSVDRKNAHEIMQDGKHYILGIGGYNGTNPDKATDVASELAELSAEVSGLSEKVDKLPTAESSVFKAVYGTTTIEEVTEAYNQGKVIHCDYNGMCFVLSAFNGGQAFFTSLSANYSTRLELKSDSRWAISYFTMEENKNKVKTISESSTDTQYPSAKAVYDALQNLGGESSVFEAEYGVTTYEEIVEARNAGKMVICQRGYDVTILTQLSDTRANFGALIAKQLIRLSCVKGGSWSYEMNDAAHSLTTLANGNAEITISGKTAEVATPQYVENAIQQSGGGSVTPDWNANEGEEGFIKNKPFNLVTEDVDFELYDGRAAAYISDIEDYDGFYILDKLMQFNGNYNFTIDYYEGFEAYHGITIELQYNDVYITPNYTDEFDSIESFVDHCNEIIKVSKIKVIDTFFIPDTVIKTTPQELLDTDKNQALSNLGIDPIVWKYICNPLIIEEGISIPDELYDKDRDWLKYEYPAMYRFYDGMEYKFCVKANYDRLTDSKDQDWYINMQTFYLE